MLAWYILFGTFGAAGGTLLCGWVVEVLKSKANWKETDAYSAIFWGYALIGLIKFLLSVILSPKCEAEKKSMKTAPPQTTPAGGDSETQPLLANSDDEEQKTNREQHGKPDGGEVDRPALARTHLEEDGWARLAMKEEQADGRDQG